MTESSSIRHPLFGSYAKGTARPDSNVDIAIFHPDPSWDKIGREIGGVHMGLEGTLNKQVDLSVCPPDAGCRLTLELRCCPLPLIMSSDEKKERLQFMERTCEDLIKHINDVNSIGGVSMLNDLSEHVISNCVNPLGRSIKNRDLEFDAELQKKWSDLRDTPLVRTRSVIDMGCTVRDGTEFVCYN